MHPLARLMLLVAFLLSVFLAVPARADGMTVQASEQDGYGRLILTFDDPPEFETKLSGGILVISFSKPVDGKTESAGQGLPNFVSVVRRDPDGMAIRLALSRRVKINTMAAGEKLFVDLMPETWAGMPPPLPADVVADLSRRTLDAERVKRELARVQTRAPAKMDLSVGSNGERARLTFSFSEMVEVGFKSEGQTGILTVPGETEFDPALARAVLPRDITEFRAEKTGGLLIVRFTVPAGQQLRGLSEDRAFVVDVAPPAKLEPAAEIEVPAPRTTEVDKAVELKDAPPAGHAPTPDAPKLPSSAATAEPKEVAAPADVAPVHLQAPLAALPESAPPAPAPEPQPTASAAQDAAPKIELAPSDGVRVRKSDGTLQISFPFTDLPPAAAFARGNTMFVVFDGAVDFDTSNISAQTDGLVSGVQKVPTGSGTAFALTLNQSRLGSLTGQGGTWTLALGEEIAGPTRPIPISPSFSEDGRTSLRAKLEGIGVVHRVPDAKVGDELLVVTLSPPARGMVREREFIEFGALPTVQGLAFKAYADDLKVETMGDGVVVTRDKGLTISLDAAPAGRGTPAQLKPGSPFAAEAWRKAKLASVATTDELARTAAAAPAEERTKARLQLARFELASGNAAETKAILDVAASESPGFEENPDVRLLRGTSLVMLRRFEEATRALNAGPLAENGEAALWRMIAEAGLGHIALAREAFAKGEPVLDAMPGELQRIFRQTMIEVAVSAQDFATAATQLDALDALNVGEGWAMREVLRGRIAEGFDQPALALEAYRRAMESDEEAAKAQARLHATNLRYKTNEIQRAEAIKDLENLTTYWRGDIVEAEALASLTDLYKTDRRWRDAFTTLRTAMNYHADARATRASQDEMAAVFSQLFLSEGPDAAPPTLESVALFYDFKELTPPGRKGDDLIRKLADRLVEVDLLTQAADLLTYQVKNRLQGGARAQVAAYAAAIELMDRKPGRALNMLHETRLAGLPPDLVRNRLMLEARALSELQRPDIALEMIAAYSGDDANRLRADIQWAAQRWQSAAEALEVMLGTSWRKDTPLSDEARQDVLRAAIAYALAEDIIGLDRLRQKYALKFADTPDQTTFDTVTAPADARGVNFSKIARAVSLADTLKGFLEDYRKRYPESAPPVVRLKDEASNATTDARG